MSSPIWTPGALSSEFRLHAGRCWRLVEAQHRVSTLRLVDTLAEHEVLETILEESKPVVPPECGHLHYLLFTPFRYGAPYPHGSRFRRAGRTAGVFYAAESPQTALAETVFHRLLFFVESPGTPWPDNAAEYTAFAADLAADRALDLTEPPLSDDEAEWTHPTEYGPCQLLADDVREAGGALIRYRSVRDPDDGANLAVLTCAAFAAAAPVERRAWRIRIGAAGAQAVCETPPCRTEFARDAFDDPRLAAIGWGRG